jgi:hypothetical protein
MKTHTITVEHIRNAGVSDATYDWTASCDGYLARPGRTRDEAVAACRRAVRARYPYDPIKIAEIADAKTRLPQLTVLALAAQGVVDAADRHEGVVPSLQLDELRDALAAIKAKS